MELTDFEKSREGIRRKGLKELNTSGTKRAHILQNSGVTLFEIDKAIRDTNACRQNRRNSSQVSPLKDTRDECYESVTRKISKILAPCGPSEKRKQKKLWMKTLEEMKELEQERKRKMKTLEEMKELEQERKRKQIQSSQREEK